MSNELLESAKRGVARAGRINLIKYLQGNRLTKLEAIKAKCYDCDGMGDSGSCDVQGCALYPYSPYRGKLAKTSRKSTGSDLPEIEAVTKGA